MVNFYLRGRALSDGPAYAAAAPPAQSASLSAGLFGRATVPIPATSVSSHTGTPSQSWLPQRRESPGPT